MHHEHDCGWISDICKIAAEGGQLECLKYAHEHDCDWISDICKDCGLKAVNLNA